MSTTKTITLIRSHGSKINSTITLLSNEFNRILHDENHPNVTDYFAENMDDFFSSVQSCRHLIARMTFLAKSKKDVETNFSLLRDELIELLNALYSPTVSFDENFGRVNNELESDVEKMKQAIKLLENVHENQEPDVVESLSKLKSLVDFFCEKTADFTLVDNYVSYVVNHFTDINEHLKSIEQLLPTVSFDETTEKSID